MLVAGGIPVGRILPHPHSGIALRLVEDRALLLLCLHVSFAIFLLLLLLLLLLSQIVLMLSDEGRSHGGMRSRGGWEMRPCLRKKENTRCGVTDFWRRR